MKYGWFVPPVYQLSMPPSASLRSASVTGKLSGERKSSGCSARKSLQPMRSTTGSAPRRGRRVLRFMGCLLEAHVHAQGDRPDARVARVFPAELEIVLVARAGLRVVPGIPCEGEEILP